MEVTTFKVKPFPIREEATPFDRPKVLYLFGEKSGDTIHDCSSLGGDGSAAANSDIHLKINKPKICSAELWLYCYSRKMY